MTAPGGATTTATTRPTAAQAASIWPHVENHVVDLIGQHRSTIVFANSRRLAERLTARLNEIAAERPAATRSGRSTGADHRARHRRRRPRSWRSPGRRGAAPVIAKAHHGSVSKEQRALIEDDLKRGRLPCVVATSSLELGIDMGAVDLVIQIESPPSVASALQRVGRAGHQVGEVSRGVLLPQAPRRPGPDRGGRAADARRADRVAARPGQPARRPGPADRLGRRRWTRGRSTTSFDLVRRAASYAQLPRPAFDATLDLLSGRYPSDEFAELRPRIVWDRVDRQLTGRAGRAAARRSPAAAPSPTAGCSASSWSAGERPPADGSASSTRRWSTSRAWATSSRSARPAGGSRTSPTTGCWSRPRPGVPGRLPFWKGDALGRPGRARRGDRRVHPRPRGRRRAQAAIAAAEERGLDAYAAGNLVGYVHEQVEATGVLPSDRTLVVERFRDELGDWRLVVHSPYGTPVHAPWALAINARLRERYGVDGQAIASDDGIVIRIPDTDAEPPTGEVIALRARRDRRSGHPGGRRLGALRLALPRVRGPRAAAAAARPRHAARRCGSSASAARPLLEVAAKYPSFPIVLEAVRECLQDVYDLPALVGLMRRLQRREVGIHDVDTHQPSPYARSLLVRLRRPVRLRGRLPHRRAPGRRAGRSTRVCWPSCSAGPSSASCSTPRCWPRSRPSSSAPIPNDEPATPRGVADLLRLARSVTVDEVDRTRRRRRRRRRLAAPRSPTLAGSSVVRMAGEERWSAVEDVGRLRDGLGVPVPPGVPSASPSPSTTPWPTWCAASRAPTVRSRSPTSRRRLGLGAAVAAHTLQRLGARVGLLEGEFRPAGSGAEWCDAEVLRLLRRRSLARLRQEVEPVEPAALGRFLLAWQHVDRAARGRPRGVDGC